MPCYADTCWQCYGPKYNECYKCKPRSGLDVDGQCKFCDDVQGFYFDSSGLCREYCGDGKRLSERNECDDGNKEDGDGCSATCEIERETGWDCELIGVPPQSICTDVSDVYIYLQTFRENELLVRIIFNKKMIISTSANNYLEVFTVSIEGVQTDQFTYNVSKIS